MEREACGFLPEGVTVNGALISNGPLTLAGAVTGDVTCEDKLIVTGRVTGRVTAPEVEIVGVVEGDIEAGILTVAESATASGRLSVGKERAAASEAAFAAFEARLKERFPPPEASGTPPIEAAPGDKADEQRLLKLKTASDKLKAQKGKSKKAGAAPQKRRSAADEQL
ncbi:MAG TPA: polymer-forming cytoskeletal protein [Candidatus Acidoferrum sp.]|nr:polymer-forming cytoskeletal protein [Candidatus Acidoferrum sp.]